MRLLATPLVLVAAGRAAKSWVPLGPSTIVIQDPASLIHIAYT